ncbi:MAG: glycosyltransferase family 4 protein [Acetobacteraceae bacterium]|nr:glycosyltransferase family 4 protein [Acetobacteraceae bacterium]
MAGSNTFWINWPMNAFSVAFVVSSGDISGGTNVVFRHAMQLAETGVQVAIVSNPALTRKAVSWHPVSAVFSHPKLQWLDFFDASTMKFDVAIATFWITCFDLWKVNAANYVFFVQSIESRFYPPSDRMLRNIIDAMYDLPCGFITEAKWIERYLQQIHQQVAAVVPNGIDKELFCCDGPALSPRRSGKLRVLVEGAIDVEFKNVPTAIRLARQAEADEIWLLTPSDVRSYPRVDRVLSRIPQEWTPLVYRSCDLVLKLSLVEGMFGPPLEMFHCGGTCVVFDVTGHDEYIEQGRNGIVVSTGDEAGVVAALKRLREMPPLLENLKRNAVATSVSWPDWEQSSARFLGALQQLIERGTIDRAQLARYGRRLWLFWIARADAAPAMAPPSGIFPQLLIRGLRYYREYGWSMTLRRVILWMRIHDIPSALFRRAAGRLRAVARRAAHRLLR